MKSRSTSTPGSASIPPSSSSTGPAQKGVEQGEQRFLRPVQVRDEDDGGANGDDLVKEIDPGFVQTLARDKRVQLRPELEAKRQPQNLALAEPLADDRRRIAFEHPK